MRRIVIYGYGYIGQSFDKFLGNDYQVFIIDPKFAESEHKINNYAHRSFYVSSEELKTKTKLENSLRAFDLAVVCVPTNLSQETGMNDVSIVHKVVNEAPSNNILIKSTLPIGYTDYLYAESKGERNIVFSPEFVGTGKYWDKYKLNDMKNYGSMILGGTNEAVNHVIDVLMPVLGPDYKLTITSPKEAEIVKLGVNSMFSTLNIYWQKLYDLCEARGANYWKVREAMCNDPRINKVHSAIFKDKRGFGGHCLVGGSKLRTPDEIKSIEDIKVSDRVFDGEEYTIVTAISKRTVYRVRGIFARGRKIVGSLDHIHYIYEGGELVERNLSDIRPSDKVFVPEQAEGTLTEVLLGDKPNGYVKWWPSKVVLTKPIARLIGLYLSEGCSGESYGVTWSFGESAEYLADEVVDILNSMGLRSDKRLKVSEGTYGESRCWGVRCRSQGFYRFLDKIGTGYGAKTKKAPLLPNKLAKALIGGWLDGDGSYYDGTIAGHSESLDLIASLDILLLSLGINAHISHNSKDLKISLRNDVKEVCGWTKRLKFNADHYVRDVAYASPTLRKVDGGWVMPVKSVTDFSGQEVYAIETESGRYVANNILTHNCLPKDTKTLAKQFKESGIKNHLLDGVLEANKYYQK